MSFYVFQVPLGILHHNENRVDEMSQIMDHIHQYVPSKSVYNSRTLSNGDVFDQNNQFFHRTLFGGDQLTVARARGGIAIRQDHDVIEQNLDGLLQVVEDWHAKQCLLKVCKL